MEVTSSSSAWSHRPAPDLIGVSVFQRQNQLSLRFHLRATHLERINNPKTLGIRGSAQNGFILTPDSETGQTIASCQVRHVLCDADPNQI